MLTGRKTAEALDEISKGAARVTKSPEGKEDTRKTEPGTPALQELFRRIEGEYREMPGLSLTLPQAERLWGLDRRTCEFALATLIERRVLRRGMNGTYLCGSSG
jgi:DNA-binding transcriptional LysR family regulator